jgi:drug/metabolite transporter (DMT)-like permease
VSVVSPFDYLQIVGATIYGWMLFSDVPTAHTVIGAALIATSGLYTAWREHRRRVQQAASVVPAV